MVTYEAALKHLMETEELVTSAKSRQIDITPETRLRDLGIRGDYADYLNNSLPEEYPNLMGMRGYTKGKVTVGDVARYISTTEKREEFLEFLKSAISEGCEVPEDEITPDTRLKKLGITDTNWKFAELNGEICDRYSTMLSGINRKTTVRDVAVLLATAPDR